MTQPVGEWRPVVEEAEDLVSPAVARAMHGLLDGDGAAPVADDPLPPLWHWLAFLPRTPQRDLGEDGHPRRGAFMPPAEGRRMFAGGDLRFSGVIPVGASVRRSSVVSNVEEKRGRSGSLVFVTVTHDHSVDGHGVVLETQDIVYRPAPTGSASPAPAAAPSAPVDGAEGAWDWRFDLDTHPTSLFRFSALTYNAHRIHYDRTYATEVEGYPGLVVHGPLQAMALAELCRRNLPDRVMRSFRFRAVRPAFDGHPLGVSGRLAGVDNVSLAVLDHTGQVTMRAEAELEPIS